MRTIKEISNHYCPNGVILEDDQHTVCKQYAKEAIQEVLRQYYDQNNLAIRNGSEIFSIDFIALKVIKELK